MRYDLWQNDVEPPLKMDLVGSAPLPVGVTAQFVMAQVNGAKRVAGPAVIDSLTVPTVHYSWQVGDTSTPGVYRAVWKIIFGDGPESFPSDEPFYIIIHPSL